MQMTKDDAKSDLLKELFDAENQVRQIHEELLELPSEELLKLLADSIKEALDERDAEQKSIRLTLMAELLGELEGPEVVDLLISILGSDDVESRREAGEALEALAFDRFKEVALGIERHIASAKIGDHALTELPYVLVSVPEPGVVKVLGQFLKHADPDAVAAAIESLAELGDAGGKALLRPLFNDKRRVDIEDATGIVDTVTIGELAKEAEELISG